MRILIVSDNHRHPENLYSVFHDEKFDAVIHLGDTGGAEREIEAELQKVWPMTPIKFLKGNCDFGADAPEEDAVYYAGVRLFLCHGHRYHVKNSRLLLAETARSENCAAALYGHTHKPDLEILGGVYVFNPGSIAEPRQFPPAATYGILEIDKNRQLNFEHHRLDF